MSETSKAEELRLKTREELEGTIRDHQEELFRLRFQKTIGQLENVSRMRQVKKEIARAMTVLQEDASGIRPLGTKAAGATE